MGFGSEKKNNMRQSLVKVRTEQHDGSDISCRVTFRGAKARKPLLGVSGVIDKGDIVVFDGSGSCVLPDQCTGVASGRKAITGVQGRIPLHGENGVFILRTWEPGTSPTDFGRWEAPRKGGEA